MNKFYDALFKSLKSLDDLSQIHECFYQSNQFSYDDCSDFLEDLECCILNLRDFIIKLVEKTK